ncbi:MAG: PhzF family phenazine biosynthesis protein [Candidatus Thiodiazotropha sp.]
MTHQVYIVDVFAEQPYSGNQLAVIVGEDALSTETMQQLAAEMNFSETTFVTSEPGADGAYSVRVFTPAREIDFTGHPILGTAWVIRRYVSPESYDVIRLELAIGQVPVAFETSADGREVAWFIAPPMSLGATTSSETVAAALGILPEDIDSKAPIQVVSAGTSAMIVPLCSLDALQRSKLDLERFAPLAAQGFPPLVYLFCQQTRNPKNHLSARFFFDAHGVREDPATGNGAAFLGAYLLHHKVLPETEIDLRIEQGYEVRRPSLVMLQASIQDGARKVRVGGYIITTLKGELT